MVDVELPGRKRAGFASGRLGFGGGVSKKKKKKNVNEFVCFEK